MDKEEGEEGIVNAVKFVFSKIWQYFAILPNLCNFVPDFNVLCVNEI